MARTLKVTAEPLPEDRLLFMHSTIATAEIEEGKLEWTVSVAGVTLSQRVVFTDGTEVTETMDLQPMLQKWGTAVVAEHIQPLDVGAQLNARLDKLADAIQEEKE